MFTVEAGGAGGAVISISICIGKLHMIRGDVLEEFHFLAELVGTLREGCICLRMTPPSTPPPSVHTYPCICLWEVPECSHLSISNLSQMYVLWSRPVSPAVLRRNQILRYLILILDDDGGAAPPHHHPHHHLIVVLHRDDSSHLPLVTVSFLLSKRK